jgi:hypothetical protein
MIERMPPDSCASRVYGDTHKDEEVTMQQQQITPRNPVVAAFGSVEVKRHQIHQDKRRRVKHRDRVFIRDEDG